MFFVTFIEAGFFISLVINALLFIPQAVKIYRAKNSSHISLVTFLGFNVIQFFIASHAYIVNDTSLLIGGLLAFITCGSVTVLTLIYR